LDDVIRSCNTGQSYTRVAWMELEIDPRKRTAHFETWSEDPLHRCGKPHLVTCRRQRLPTPPNKRRGGESWDVTVKTKNPSSMWTATTLNLYTQHIEEDPTLDTSSATTPLNPKVENAQVDGYLNVHQRRGFRIRREETRERRGETCLFRPFSPTISFLLLNNFFKMTLKKGTQRVKQRKNGTRPAVAQQQLCKKIFPGRKTRVHVPGIVTPLDTTAFSGKSEPPRQCSKTCTNQNLS